MKFKTALDAFRSMHGSVCVCAVFMQPLYIGVGRDDVCVCVCAPWPCTVCRSAGEGENETQPSNTFKHSHM